MTRRRQAKFKKNPDAPRRFKSSFMFFSQRKHPELRKQMIENGVQEGTVSTKFFSIEGVILILNNIGFILRRILRLRCCCYY